jgi:XTP/dITP diphosphohydrolase
MAGRTLVLASTNRGKLVEMQALLANCAIELVTPLDLGLDLDICEDGNSYAENAAKKALGYARQAGLPALGDDSGLEVLALNGAPGLHSHRFVPLPAATDADRRAYLLDQLRPLPRPWLARFLCLVALARPDGQVQYTEGVCPGEIIPEERGQNGFGYDPIFLLPQLGRTMAELSLEEKNRLSHRARAVRAAIPLIDNLFL